MTESFIYITAPDVAEAARIGAALVEERLVACVNIIDKMQSIYWWQGKVEHAAEVVLIAKTRTELVEPLIARVKALHPYECPCVVALPIAAGNPEYLAWIHSETHNPGEPPSSGERPV